MMARNTTFRSRAGYRSARPITSKSSLSACNARPVHTDVPYADQCVGRNPHVAYSANATRATEEAVKVLLQSVFKLN